MTYRVEVVTNDKGSWVRIVHVNGNVIFHSEQYSRKWNARRAGRKVAKTFRLEYREVSE